MQQHMRGQLDRNIITDMFVRKQYEAVKINRDNNKIKPTKTDIGEYFLYNFESCEK